MWPLPVMSITTKLAILFGVVLLTNIFTATKTWQFAADRFEAKIQADKIITVEKTVEIAKRDLEAEQRAVARARKQWEIDNATTEAFLDYIANNPIVRNPVCTLDADGLRLWNNENRGVEVQ